MTNLATPHAGGSPSSLLLLSCAGGVQALRDKIRDGHAAKLFAMLRRDVHDAMARGVYLPTSDCSGRASHHRHHGNRDFIIVDAVAHRLKNDSLMWRITGEARYYNDALAQLEAIFDDARWPSWIDAAHEANGLVADLRTGQLLAAIGYAYSWLYDALSDTQRRWIIEETDRRAIQPLLHEMSRDAWFTRTEFINNWNTVILGGAGIAGLAFGKAHAASERLVSMASRLMDLYLAGLGPEGEFNESVAYAGAMHCPIEFFAAHRSQCGDAVDRLADSAWRRFCDWYLHFILPSGRSAPLGDGPPDAPPKALIFAAIAAATGDGVYQWAYLEHASAGSRSDPALELLLFDPTIKPVSPEGRRPRGRAFYAHGALWSSRTDWNPRSTACVVYGKGGHGNECHGHHDAGQVCIDIAARPMIVDLGHPAPSYPADFFGKNRWRYYNAGVMGHNVLMFDEREMRGEATDKGDSGVCPYHAKVLDAEFDDARGGYWRGDMTDLYAHARRVIRTVVHLHPAVIAVLDEAELDQPRTISLRWHTADRCEPDDAGQFTVHNDGAHLVARVCRLDGTMSFTRREHRYEPPFDRARLDVPLIQRHESFIDATCHAARCRVLTLFSGYAPGEAPAQWTPTADGWSIATPCGIARVRVLKESLILEPHEGHGWAVPLHRYD